jgi:hypothetical protein
MGNKINDVDLGKVMELIKGTDDPKEKIAIARAVLSDVKTSTSNRPILDAVTNLLGLERGSTGNINLISLLTSNRGLIGAWGTYQLYSLAGYMLNPVEDRFTAIISEYYGNNAVTVSGLYSKGEPFVANLEGMKKGSVIANGTITDMLVGRFVQNFDYLKQSIYESATSPLIEAEAEFSRLEAEQNLDNTTRKLKQFSEIGNTSQLPHR